LKEKHAHVILSRDVMCLSVVCLRITHTHCRHNQ